MSGGRLDAGGLLAAPVAKWTSEAVRTAFVEATAQFDNHPAALELGQIATRTSRSIAAAPTWLYGPEVTVRLPFVHPDVLGAALGVPNERKRGGALYRDILRIACGERIADLASTNDGRGHASPVARRQTSPAAIRAVAETIRADDAVRQLLSPRLATALTDHAECARLVHSSAVRVTLQWAEMLCEWRRRHAARLTWSASPW
jgi:hypothetical protein